MADSRLRYSLRNLRHLYEQMIRGEVKDTAQAAKGLLAPAIEAIEAEDQAQAWSKDHHADA